LSAQRRIDTVAAQASLCDGQSNQALLATRL